MVLVESLQTDFVLTKEFLERPEAVLEFRVAFTQNALLGLVELGHRTRQHPARGGLEERLHIGDGFDVISAFSV